MSPRRSQLGSYPGDPYLEPYRPIIQRRQALTAATRQRLTGGRVSLADFASGHEYFGLHRTGSGWRAAEWAPNAADICLIGTFSGWRESDEYRLRRINHHGIWCGEFAPPAFGHGDLYRLKVRWDGGEGERIPAYARRVVQDETTRIFSAMVWVPGSHYAWRHAAPKPPGFLLVYETHVGMAQERGGVGTYDEFRRNVIPRVVDAGYNALQIMGLLEHPYYGSFGYHVGSYFAASSRFGTPEELKALVDEAHAAGLLVIVDLVHSHAAANEVEGLARFDGTTYQYFHEGARGVHPAWGSRCFDYGKPEVLHFLLSNCRFWLDEYRVDGYRFDGVTSMLYRHHGLGYVFSSYEDYFGGAVDEDALVYLTLANEVVHAVNPSALTIAEDVSGMPGLAARADHGGCGFDYRLAMGVPDCWSRLVAEVPDEQWSIGWLWHELTNRRHDERAIGYVESHDQAIVGGKTLIFAMIDVAMYDSMAVSTQSAVVDRGVALHKMARLFTFGSAGHGYLNFMGNEFGHPEWVDFPREGNGWSYHYARRQWHLRDAEELRYRFLADFDRAMLALASSDEGFGSCQPRLVRLDETAKIVVFARDDYFFFLNFNAARSVVDYAVEVLPGEYCWVMDTDERRFGGQGRIQPGQQYIAFPVVKGRNLQHCVQVYLPCRVGLVARRTR